MQIQQETLQLRTALAQSHAQQKEDHAVREQLQATLTQLRAENRRTSLQVCPCRELLACTFCTHVVHDCSGTREPGCCRAADPPHVRMGVPACLQQG